MISRGIFGVDRCAGVLGGAPQAASRDAHHRVAAQEAAQWDLTGARTLGAAAADVAGWAGRTVMLGRDTRPGSAELSRALALGLAIRGAHVVDLGTCGRDELVFSCGRGDLPGVHAGLGSEPAGLVGATFLDAGARPLPPGFLTRLAETALHLDALARVAPAHPIGSLRELDAREEFIAHLRSQVRLDGRRPLRLVLDTAAGEPSALAARVLQASTLEVLAAPAPDAPAEAHEPDPRNPRRQARVRERLAAVGADLAVLPDGCGEAFVVLDEAGEVVAPAALAALLGPGVREIGGRLELHGLWGHSSALLVTLLLVELLGHTKAPLSSLLSAPMLRRGESPIDTARMSRPLRGPH